MLPSTWLLVLVTLLSELLSEYDCNTEESASDHVCCWFFDPNGIGSMLWFSMEFILIEIYFLCLLIS